MQNVETKNVDYLTTNQIAPKQQTAAVYLLVKYRLYSKPSCLLVYVVDFSLISPYNTVLLQGCGVLVLESRQREKYNFIGSSVRSVKVTNIKQLS